MAIAGIGLPTGYQTVTDPKTGQTKQVPITNQGSGGAVIDTTPTGVNYEAATGGWKAAGFTGLTLDQAKYAAKHGSLAGYRSESQGGGIGVAQDRAAQGAGFANLADARARGGLAAGTIPKSSPLGSSGSSYSAATTMASGGGAFNQSVWDEILRQKLGAFRQERDEQIAKGARDMGKMGVSPDSGITGSVGAYALGQAMKGEAQLTADVLAQQEAARARAEELQLRKEAIAASNNQGTWAELESNILKNQAAGISGGGDGSAGSFGVNWSSAPKSSSTSKSAPKASGSGAQVLPDDLAALKSLRTNYYDRGPGKAYGWLGTSSEANRIIDEAIKKKEAELAAAKGSGMTPAQEAFAEWTPR